MFRNFVIALLATAAMSIGDTRPAAAAPISPNNPYRSFNVSGVNYGSMRWEQLHRGRTGPSRYGWTPRRGGFFFRRR